MGEREEGRETLRGTEETVRARERVSILPLLTSLVTSSEEWSRGSTSSPVGTSPEKFARETCDFRVFFFFFRDAIVCGY